MAKKLWIMALVAVDCAILAYILAAGAMPALYGAEAQVIVTGAESALDDYARVATSRTVCTRLVNEFQLSASVDQVINSIRVEPTGQGNCLSIRLLCEDPQTSVILTDALVQYTTEAVTQLYEDTATFLCDPPTLPTRAEGTDPLTVALITFGASLLLTALAFSVPILCGYRLIDPESVEELLGIPVLGMIPGKHDRNGGNRT